MVQQGAHRRRVALASDEGGVGRRHGHLAGDLLRGEAMDVLGAEDAAAPVLEAGPRNVDACRTSSPVVESAIGGRIKQYGLPFLTATALTSEGPDVDKISTYGRAGLRSRRGKLATHR